MLHPFPHKYRNRAMQRQHYILTLGSYVSRVTFVLFYLLPLVPETRTRHNQNRLFSTLLLCSCFFLFSTLHQVHSMASVGAYSPSPPQLVDDYEPHVLAVDDSVIDRKLVEKLLKKSSYKVTTAENGIKALEYLGLSDNQHGSNSVSKVNLVITDYCMPEMTGYELLKKIKESSAMKEIPVVIMSSENVQTRINKCLEEGAQMFMLKPLKQSDVRRLREVI